MENTNGLIDYLQNSYSASLEEVKKRIKAGADINQLTSDTKANALMVALANHNKEISKYLIENNANIEHLDSKGMSALSYAAFSKLKEIVVMLIEKGADINIKDDFGDTPLSKACFHNDIELAQLILNYGALVGKQDFELAKSEKLKKILREFEVKNNKKNKEKKTKGGLASLFSKLFSNSSSSKKKAEECYQQGALFAKEQKWEKAKEKLELAVSLNPKHSKAHLAMAITYGAMMKIDLAKKHYNILKGLDPILARQFENSAAGMMILKSGGFIMM